MWPFLYGFPHLGHSFQPSAYNLPVVVRVGNVPQRLRYLHIWSPVGAVWGGLGCAVLLEEMLLEMGFLSRPPYPVCFVLTVKDVVS